MKLYILNEKTPVPVFSFEEWNAWFITANREVKLTQLDERLFVSTVFLGIDHNWSGGRPHLFETRVFENGVGGPMRRSSTWDEAEKTHDVMCEALQNELNSANAKAEGILQRIKENIAS